jgi:hypothetical protein
MYEFGTNTFIKAIRKPHQCEWCGEPIRLGYCAMKRDYRFDGQWVHEWQHLACYRAMDEVQPDEFELGTYYKGSTVRRDE